MGRGDSVLLWEDLWIGNVSLKDRFPRLYSLSLEKLSNIEDCGMCDGLAWHWNLFVEKKLACVGTAIRKAIG